MRISFLIFILGSIVGSFLNVCIYRMPREESIVSPPSHCPNCQRPIPWFYNVPLISYVLLKGRCRFCSTRISFRYFIVELITAVIFLMLFNHYGFSIKFLIYTALTSSLIAATFIDFEHQIIPDEITLGGLVVGLILSIIYPALHSISSSTVWHNLGLSLLQSVIGMIAGGGSIYLIGVIGTWLFRKDSMGGGDVKLMAMLGAFLGWKLALLIIVLGAFLGSIFGIISLIKNKSHVIPFGPYLSIGAFLCILYGDEMLQWIMRYMGI
ncbi:MAG: prepilin peptidase [Candidatus Omnitrophica bacterium]|nr:prepilin peptidase [Candidatus Omnitrophota bacterium]